MKNTESSKTPLNQTNQNTNTSKNKDLVAHHLATNFDGKHLDYAVSSACGDVLWEVGIRRIGQQIRINKGRYARMVAVIEQINWSEAEVWVSRQSKWGKGGRWFSLWHDRDAFTVLDPSFDPPTRPRAVESPLSPSDPALRSSSSTTPSEARKSASSRPAPSWIPQKRS